MENVTKDQAQDYLESIEKVQRQTRRAFAAGGAPIYMAIWGTVWLIGYLGNYFLSPEVSGYLWLGVDVLGLAASFGVGWRYASRVRSTVHDARIAIFWLLWLVYTALVVWLSGSTASPARMDVVISLMAMFGYAVMGLWLWLPLVGVGGGMSVLIVAAYLTVPQYLDLIMALLGGGTLIFSGIYIYRYWR